MGVAVKGWRSQVQVVTDVSRMSRMRNLPEIGSISVAGQCQYVNPSM